MSLCCRFLPRAKEGATDIVLEATGHGVGFFPMRVSAPVARTSALALGDLAQSILPNHDASKRGAHVWGEWARHDAVPAAPAGVVCDAGTAARQV
jgi:hypothetical protein